MTTTPPPRRPPNPLRSKGASLPADLIAELLPDHPWVGDDAYPLPEAWVVAADLVISNIPAHADYDTQVAQAWVHAPYEVFAPAPLGLVLDGRFSDGWGMPTLLAAGTSLVLDCRSPSSEPDGLEPYQTHIWFHLADARGLGVGLVLRTFQDGIETRTIGWNDLAVAAVVVPVEHALASDPVAAAAVVQRLIAAHAASDYAGRALPATSALVAEELDK